MVKKNDDNKIFAFLAVFLSIIGFIIAILTKKEDKYVMFYAKQSLVLFIFGVIISIIISIIGMIPVIGMIIGIIGYVVMLVFWIMQIINSLSEKEKLTPLIGKYGEKFNF